MRGSRAKRRPSSALLLAALLGVIFCCGGIRQDELDCEEAVSHLQECCPGFSGNDYACEYVSGCDQTTVPDISISESSCVRGRSCAQLASSGVCTRAIAHTPGAQGALCP